MNILITGCAGFIGFSLIRELIKNKKYNVIGVDNLNNINDDLKLKKKKKKKKKINKKKKIKKYKKKFKKKKKIKT